MDEFIHRPELVIFLVTIVSYIFSFLVYGGYLSAFAGSVGNTPFAFADLSIFDLLAILPMAIVTVLVKVFSGIGRAALFVVVYLVIPFTVGLFVRVIYGQFIPSEFATLAMFVGLTLWTIAVTTVGWKNIKYISLAFIGVFLLVIISGLLVFGGASTSQQVNASPTPSTIIAFFNVFSAFWFVVFVLLGAFVWGGVTAETVVKRQALSQVSQLVLKQPIPSFGVARQLSCEESVATKKKWFTRSSVPVSIEPDAYCYCSSKDKPVYLVSTFRNFTLFFIPENKSDKKLQGKLVSVFNPLISSIELEVRMRLKS